MDGMMKIQIQMGEVAKDLGAGTVGGIAQLVVGHPFDTITVKLQSQPTQLSGQLLKYSGAIDAVKQTLSAEGARGLYKGMGAPLATVAAFNTLLFSVRGQMETLSFNNNNIEVLKHGVEFYSISNLMSEPGAPLTVQQQVIAGAGCAVSILATPTELIKCRLQAQGASAGSGVVAEAGAAVTAAVKYGGPMDVAKQVLRTEGGVRKPATCMHFLYVKLMRTCTKAATSMERSQVAAVMGLSMCGTETTKRDCIRFI